MLMSKVATAKLVGVNEPSAADIVAVFNQCFAQAYAVEMRGGADEPLYLPATLDKPAELIFREDFPASALHEAAHWCIAGEQRRNSPDFAYTYIAAPRSDAQQALFFAAEPVAYTHLRAHET